MEIWGAVATTALIAFAVRHVLSAKGQELPKFAGEAQVYGLKWPLRVVGFAGLALSIGMFIWSYAEHDISLLVIPVLFAAASIQFVSASVCITKSGITKKVLWRSSKLEWPEVTSINVTKRDGGAIVLKSASRKLIIDMRFAARERLLQEIENRTGLQRTGDKLP